LYFVFCTRTLYINYLCFSYVFGYLLYITFRLQLILDYQTLPYMASILRFCQILLGTIIIDFICLATSHTTTVFTQFSVLVLYPVDLSSGPIYFLQSTMIFIGGVPKLTSSNRQFRLSELDDKKNTEGSGLMSQQHSTFDCPTTATRIPIYTNPHAPDLSWNSSQASWGKLVEPISLNPKDAKLTDKWSSVIQPLTISEPCFDPYEPTNRTAQIYSDAYIPCTVRNTDFMSTVMSWWREGSLRELTVGNEVISTRYRIDKSDPHSWTLVIKNVTEKDSGVYICQINLAKLKEKFFSLTVVKPSAQQNQKKLHDQYVKDEGLSSFTKSSQRGKFTSYRYIFISHNSTYFRNVWH
ncbi:hypothetical protein EG68_10449, partial [Paragonimus skrjabini miyazakii]